VGRNAVAYTLDTTSDRWAQLCLGYDFGEAREPVTQPILLTTTALPSGGLRWWMRCPFNVRGSACWALTYRSCQESNKHVAGYRRMYAEVLDDLREQRPCKRRFRISKRRRLKRERLRRLEEFLTP
jgi:hypothetical protein